MADITLDFNTGVIKKDLAELPDKMLAGAFEALNDAADFMVVMAKSYVLVDTGSLQKSIRKERGGVGLHRRVVRVRAGGYVTNPKTHKIVDYAVYVERKNPYMKPAWESVRRFIIRKIREGVLQRVNR